MMNNGTGRTRYQGWDDCNVSQASVAGAMAVGPSTYLHAGYSKTGWPYDPKAEDTFDLPKLNAAVEGETWDRLIEEAKVRELEKRVFSPVIIPDPSEVTAEASLLRDLLTTTEQDTEYYADGEFLMQRLSVTTTERKLVAKFEHRGIAERSAHALNNHEGY